MGQVRERIDEAREERRRFSPAGQSTQLIVGADAEDDAAVLATSEVMYGRYDLKRVYYSAFSPIPEASAVLPVKAPPLLRENRLYQADWLLRYYGFTPLEIVSGGEGGMLDLEIDPKLAWALKFRESFPVDVNKAPRETLLRVPGLDGVGGPPPRRRGDHLAGLGQQHGAGRAADSTCHGTGRNDAGAPSPERKVLSGPVWREVDSWRQSFRPSCPQGVGKM